jgi:hypothetical protein
MTAPAMIAGSGEGLAIVGGSVAAASPAAPRRHPASSGNSDEGLAGGRERIPSLGVAMAAASVDHRHRRRCSRLAVNGEGDVAPRLAVNGEGDVAPHRGQRGAIGQGPSSARPKFPAADSGREQASASDPAKRSTSPGATCLLAGRLCSATEAVEEISGNLLEPLKNEPPEGFRDARSSGPTGRGLPLPLTRAGLPVQRDRLNDPSSCFECVFDQPPISEVSRATRSIGGSAHPLPPTWGMLPGSLPSNPPAAAALRCYHHRFFGGPF